MIDTTLEKPISLAQAAAELPPRRAGRPASVSCLYRWSTAGCRGVVLETIQIGGTRCTSREALQRFFEGQPGPMQAGVVDAACQPVVGIQPVRAVTHRSIAQRQRAAAEAGRRLEEMGA